MINRNYLKKKQSAVNIKNHHEPQRIHSRKILFFFLCTLVVFIGIDFLIRPSVQKVMEYHCRMIATDILSKQTIALLKDTDISYDDFVSITKDDTGAITSVETNVKEVNKVKSTLEHNVTSAFYNAASIKHQIPLGTLTGNEFLSGRGPNIELSISPLGYVSSNFVSKFQSVGINQTSHQLILEISLEVTSVIPFHKADISVETEFILAETIIVGKIPDYYTQITGGEGSTSKYTDFSLDPFDFKQTKNE